MARGKHRPPSVPRAAAPGRATPPDPDASARADAVRAVLAATALFVPLAMLVARLVPVPELSTARDVLLARPTQFHPEPAERAIYLISLAFFPAAFAAFALLLRTGRLRPATGRAELAVLGVGAAAALGAASGDRFFYLRTNLLGTAPLAAAAAATIALAGLAAARKPAVAAGLRRVVLWGVPAAFALILVLSALFDHRDPYVGHKDGHFESVFFTLARAWLGDPPLVGCANQYGLYAVYLAPLFRVVGLDVFRYALLMALLAATSVLLLLPVARHLAGSPVLGTAIWGAWVGACGLALRPYVRDYMVKLVGSFFIDPYFQYAPLRTLVPALVTLLAMLRLRGRSRWPAVAGSAVAAFGVPWNVDSGLVAWGAWMLLGAYLAAAAAPTLGAALRGVARAVLVEAGALACALLVLWAYYRGVLGATPDWTDSVRYQTLYYGAGVGMLPMSLPHSWMVAAAVLLLGLAHSIGALVRGRAAPRDALVFFLSVLGAGVFSYYQGRSHDWNLPAVVWPAWLLAGGYLGTLLRPRRPVLQAAATAVLAMCVATGLLAGWRMRQSIRDRLETIASPPGETERDFAFLRERLGGRRALVLSYEASVLHVASGTRPAYCPALSEMATRADMGRLSALVDGGTVPVVVDQAFLQIASIRHGFDPVVESLRSRYVVAATSPSGRFRLMQAAGAGAR